MQSDHHAEVWGKFHGPTCCCWGAGGVDIMCYKCLSCWRSMVMLLSSPS
jgi:hypothetical protein